MTEILAVAGDAGGAAALLPVLRALQQTPDTHVRAFAYRQAVDIWSRTLEVQSLPDATTIDDVEAALGDARVDLLLTGTSVNGIDQEPRFWRWAERHDVPSIAVLDFWTNYEARFRGDGPPLFPSRVAVMDEIAARDLVTAGVPPERINVTGQPAFDHLRQFGEAWTTERRDGMREAMHAGGDARVVLFASQPLASEMAALGCTTGNLDEREVLRFVAASLEAIAADDHEIVLVVRPHPREQLSAKELPKTERIRIALATDGDSWSAALAADLVVGINSVLLLEACLLGCVVVSVQPGGADGDPLPTNRSGHSTPVYELSQLESTLRCALLSEDFRARCSATGSAFAAGGATARVVDLIQETLAFRAASL